MDHSFLKRVTRRFFGERDGSVTVETVICIPILFWALVATWEFFEIHRFKSAREKATYTIADLLSREMTGVNNNYIDNMLTLYGGMAHDDGTNQIRISVLRYHDTTDQYSVFWSEVRGEGSKSALSDADVQAAQDTLLSHMNDGEQLIVVESESKYEPTFNVGLGDGVEIETRMFTKLRFSSRLCHDDKNISECTF